MKTFEVEKKVVNYLDPRKFVIVPNVSWSMFNYELDLCALDFATLYAREIEIKISKSDLKRDADKKHCHDSNLIKYLYFAMPEYMKDCVDLVPERAGILLVWERSHRAFVFRKPTPNPNAQKWTVEQAYKLARLGTMRFWDLYYKNSPRDQKVQAGAE